MIIDDEAEIWGLASALLELKFGEQPHSVEIAGSLPLSKVFHRLWQEFQTTRIFRSQQNAWVSLQITPERREWSRVVSWIKQSPAWNSWSVDEKKNYVQMLAFPCVIHPDFMEQMLVDST